MTQYDETNRGVLFRNDRKESDRHPDYTGNVNVGGRDYWLSAWIKKSKTGQPYMSLSVKPKDGKTPEQKSAETAAEDFDDALPF